MGDTDALAQEREALARQHSDLLDRRRRWQDAYEAGVIDLTDFAGRLDELDEAERACEDEVARVDEVIERGHAAEDLAETVRSALANLPQSIPERLPRETAQRLRAVFRRLFRRVVVDGDEVLSVVWRL